MNGKKAAKFVNHNRNRRMNFRYNLEFVKTMIKAYNEYSIGNKYDPNIHTIYADDTGVTIYDKKTGKRLNSTCWCCYDKVIVVVDL